MLTRLTVNEAAKQIIVDSNITQKKLAEKMNVKNQQTVFNMLNADKGMRTDNFIKMMDALGHDVIIRNRINDSEIILVCKEEES